MEFVDYPAPDETKPCPVCGKNMLHGVKNTVKLTDPAIYEWEWLCKCGHREKGGFVREKSAWDLFSGRWEQANK